MKFLCLFAPVVVRLLFLAFLPVFSGTVSAAGVSMEKARVVSVAEMPAANLSKSGTVRGRHISLRSLRANKNDITDVKEWFARNDLYLPVIYEENIHYPESRMPPYGLPYKYGSCILRKLIEDDDYLYLIYSKRDRAGDYLFVLSRKDISFVCGYDFAAYPYDPKHFRVDPSVLVPSVKWAKLLGGTLYVSQAHSTYASSSGGKNGYISAIDIRDNRILWRSRPLVANAENFVIIDDIIVSGYGFTSEPDYLYLVDRKSGKIVKRYKVKSGPDYIIKKESRIFVRTYNTDYVYKVICHYGRKK